MQDCMNTVLLTSQEILKLVSNSVTNNLPFA